MPVNPSDSEELRTIVGWLQEIPETDEETLLFWENIPNILRWLASAIATEEGAPDDSGRMRLPTLSVLSMTNTTILQTMADPDILSRVQPTSIRNDMCKFVRQWAITVNPCLQEAQDGSTRMGMVSLEPNSFSNVLMPSFAGPSLSVRVRDLAKAATPLTEAKLVTMNSCLYTLTKKVEPWRRVMTIGLVVLSIILSAIGAPLGAVAILSIAVVVDLFSLFVLWHRGNFSEALLFARGYERVVQSYYTSMANAFKDVTSSNNNRNADNRNESANGGSTLNNSEPAMPVVTIDRIQNQSRGSTSGGNLDVLRGAATESPTLQIPSPGAKRNSVSVSVASGGGLNEKTVEVPRTGSLMFNVGRENENKVLRIDAAVLHEHVMLVGLRKNMSIALWNHGAELVTGFDMKTCLGSSILGLMNEKSKARFLSHMDKAQLGEEDKMVKEVDAIEVTMIHATKQVVTVRLHVVPAQFINGAHGGLFLVGHLLAPTNEASTTAQQTFVVHKALQHATTFLKHCADVATTPPAVTQSAIQCVRYIQALHPTRSLDMSFRWSNFVPINLRQYVGDLSSRFGTSASAHGEARRIECDVSPSIPEFSRWDSEKLTDIVSYLIRNSLRAGAKRVMIKNYVNEETTSMGEKLQMVHIEIADKGTGIPSDRFDQIHRAGAFTTANANSFRIPRPQGQKAHRLAFITEALEMMGGALHCTNTPDEGTTVIVSIPYIPAQGFGGQQNDDNFKSNTLQSIRATSNIRLDAVLVEGNLMYRTAITQMLWQGGHSLSIANDFADLTQILETHNTHVVFLDSANLPADDTALDALRDKNITVCIMVDRDFSENQRYKYSALGYQVLMRPVSATDMGSVLTKATEVVVKERERQAHIAQIRSIFTQHNTCSWERVEKLGSGAFGDVYKARDLTTGGIMAVKVIKLSAEDRDAEQKVTDLVNEVALLRTLEHENIIHYLYCERGDGCINVFMEYANSGTVDGVMKGKPLAPAKAAAYMRELVRAVAFLHENSIMHRDIKCANLMLSDGKLKLGDFGTACRIDPDHEQTEMKGTLRFMAPEVAKEEPHDTKCDIWSIGCTLMEMLTGRQPMPHIEGNYLQTIAALCRMEPGDVVPIPDSITGQARNFISACLHVNPEKRPTAKTLLTDPFLTHTAFSERQKDLFAGKRARERFKKAFDKIRAAGAIGRLLGKKSAFGLASTLPTDAPRPADEVEPNGLVRMESKYFDRKFSGWGEPLAPIARAAPGGGFGTVQSGASGQSLLTARMSNAGDAQPMAFSGWGLNDDDDDDDEDNEKRGSVWSAYDDDE
eukprot:PhM_4_TR2110/c2_g1_i2/m.57468